MKPAYSTRAYITLLVTCIIGMGAAERRCPVKDEDDLEEQLNIVKWNGTAHLVAEELHTLYNDSYVSNYTQRVQPGLHDVTASCNANDTQRMSSSFLNIRSSCMR